MSAPFLASCAHRYGSAGCSLSFYATAGKTYWLQLNVPSVSGSVSATLTLAYGGPGDDLANATIISPLAPASTWTSTVDVTAMTFEAGETAAGDGSASNYGALPRRSMWWSYTPTSSGTVMLSGRLNTSSMSISMSVREAGAVTAPILNSCAHFYGNRGCALNFYGTAGRTYWLQLNVPNSAGGVTATLALGYGGPGDDLANAVVLAPLAPASMLTTTVDMTSFSSEPGETAAGDGSGANYGALATRTMWWSYTPTTSGSVRLAGQLNTSSVPLSLSVRDSASVSAPFVSACGAQYGTHGCTTRFSATAGTTYWIQANVPSAFESAVATLTLAFGGQGDDIANATTIPSLPVSSTWNETVDMTTMSSEAGETAAGDGSSSNRGATPLRTRWWSYTPSTTSTVLLHSILSGDARASSMSISIRGSASVSAPFVASCAARYGSYGCATSARLLAGTTYFFQVNVASATGSVSAAVSLGSGGPGDDIAEATLVPALAPASTWSETADLSGMSFESGETAAGAGTLALRTRWWAYTPTTSGTVLFHGSLAGAARTSRMSLSIRDSASVSAPFLASCAANYGMYGCATSLNLTAGTTYYFQLNVGSATGSVSGTVTLGFGGPGDDIASATPIAGLVSGSSWSSTVDMTSMTFEPGETSVGDGTGSNSGGLARRTRWWTYTPLTSGPITLNGKLSAGMKMSVNIRGTGSVSAPALAACAMGSGNYGCSTSATLTAGTTYYIQLNVETPTGAVSGTITVTQP